MNSKTIIVDSMMGTGKAQPLYSKVLCEDGFKTMGEINVGDNVFGEDGLLHKVVGVFPQGVKSIYEITFQDKSKVRCCDEHLWTYQLPQDKSKNIFRTDSLKEIMKKPLYKQTNKSKNYQFFIPLVSQIEFPHKDVNLDGWVLGCLIGDGCLSEGETCLFTNSEMDVIERVNQTLLEYGCRLSSNGDCGYGHRIIGETPNSNNGKSGFRNIIKIKLKQLGLLGKKSEEKFIPDIYKINDVDTRLSVIRGLVDTDGHVSNNGTIDYSTASKRLALDMKFMIESLGGLVTMGESPSHYTKNGLQVDCKTRYRLYIVPPQGVNLFSSEKHSSKVNAKRQRQLPSRNIRSITYIGEEECKCIFVDNPTHLYITDNFTVTHNTSWAIDYMNENKDKKFVYITPYLSEIERIKEKCGSRRFYDPINVGKGKLDSLNKLLLQGKNIASTHALFRTSTEETRKLIESNGYTLILDEVMNVVQPVEKKKNDFDIMLAADLIIVQDDGLVVWNEEKDDYESEYDDIKIMCANKSLFFVNNKLFMWTFPANVFDSFEKVYILTYIFNGQLQRTYYDLYNIDYSYKSVGQVDGKYQLIDFVDKYDMTYIRNKINILDDKKLNSIGNGEYALSRSWFIRNAILIEQLQKNIYNYFKRKTCSKINDNMWTSFKAFKGKLSGKGYTKGFVPIGTRATNDYVDKSCMAYCANIFVNPMIVHFFNQHGVTVDEDTYALSELIQWIWRSRIRRGEEINIYIPSERMRNLLLSWLN